MEREDKITTNNIETLRSEMRLEVGRLSARLSEEVVCMKTGTREALRVQWQLPRAAEVARATLLPT